LLDRLDLHHRQVDHLQANIEMNGINCSHETDRTAYQETLLIQKFLTRVQTAWLTWEFKMLTTTLEFMKFGPSRTSAMLGEENQAIASMFQPGTKPSVLASASLHVTVNVPNQQAQSGPSIDPGSQRSRTVLGRRASEIEVADFTGA
jgi:hypothetical protein